MFEIQRYKFDYKLDTSPHIYEMIDNNTFIKNRQEFYNLRVDLRDNILYKNLWGPNKSRPYISTEQFIQNSIINMKDKTKKILTLHFDTTYYDQKNGFLFGKDTPYQKCEDKYDIISATMYEYEVIKDMTIQQRVEYQYKPNIEKISVMMDCINDNGTYYFQLFGYDSKAIKLINLLLLLFNRIVIYHWWIVCIEYNPIIKKDELFKYLENIETVKIEPTINLKEFSEYMLESSDTYLKLIKSIKNNDLKIYFEIMDIIYLNQYIEYQCYNKNKDIDYEFEKNIYENLKITSASIISGNTVKSAIKPLEGNFIFNTIIKNNFKNCLEVGMAYGISAMYILLALKKANKDSQYKLDSIDPFQTTQWKSFGLNLIKDIKLNNNHNLYEDKSYIVLPKLLEKKEVYNLIFIDGWHTFDYTLLDFFYADLLLKVGGIIIIDDAMHQGVGKCLRYLDSNYKHYKRIQSPNTVGAYQKMSADKRDWDYHTNF
jgi:predicted O-methyltransferase YrrM